jgi:hypothetical protein
LVPFFLREIKQKQFPELGPLFLALGIGYVFSTRPAAVKVLMNQRSLSARGVATLANGHSVIDHGNLYSIFQRPVAAFNRP